MENNLTEDSIEYNLIDLLKEKGYKYYHGSTIAPNGENPQREALDSVVLEKQLKKSLEKINPTIPESALTDAYQHILHLGSNDIMNNNEKLHLMLTNGVNVDCFENGQTVGKQVNIIDFERLKQNQNMVYYGLLFRNKKFPFRDA